VLGGEDGIIRLYDLSLPDGLSSPQVISIIICYELMYEQVNFLYVVHLVDAVKTLKSYFTKWLILLFTPKCCFWDFFFLSS